MATKITTNVLADDAVTDAKIADVTLTTATQSASDNSTKIATTAYVTTAIANLADSAPSTLNTLNELAAALGDDANFSTTVTNSIATKLPLTGGTIAQTSGSTAPLKITSPLNSGQYLLELISTGNSNATIDLRANGTGDSRIFFDLNGTTPFAIGVDNSDADKFKISGNYQLGTNDRIVIDSDGDIGMGVSPATNAKLTLGGTTASYSSVLAFDNNTTGGATFFMLASDNTWSAGANKFLMGHGSPSSAAVDLTIDADGKVGIGATSPAEKLDVSGNALLSGSDGTLRKLTFGATGGNHGSIGVDASGHTFIDAETAGGAILFKSAGTDYAKLLSNGKLAVTEISHISNGSLEIGNGDEKQIFDASGASIQFQTADTERMRIDQYGAVWREHVNHGRYTWVQRVVFSGGQTRNLTFHLSGGNVHGQVRVTMSGDYSNVNANGSLEKVWGWGYNSSNTSGYGGQGSGTTILNLGYTSNVMSFGSMSKTNATTVIIPITNTSGSYQVICGITVEITGELTGLQYTSI